MKTESMLLRIVLYCVPGILNDIPPLAVEGDNRPRILQ
jgi:hypothetical protein